MSSRNLRLLLVAGLAVFAIFFLAGRSIELSSDSHSSLNSAESKRRLETATDRELPNVTAALPAGEFGRTPFPEMYRTMQSASRPMRLAWAREIEHMKIGPRRASAICSYYKTLVQIDPKTAAEAAVDIKDRVVKQIAIGALIGAAPTSAMEDLAKVLIQSKPDPTRNPNYTLDDVISEWSAVDPVAVAKFLDQTKSDQVPGCLIPLLQNWGSTDPAAAEKWFERRNPSEQTAEAISALLTGWSSHDRAGAADFLVAHSADERFLPSIRTLSYSIFLDDPDAAREFVLRLSNDPFRIQSAAVENIVTNALEPEGVGKDPAAKRSAETMARWIVSLPSETWDGLGSITATWEAEDPASFKAWLNQLPIDARDQVLLHYCTVVGPDTAERKISLAFEITDPEVREQTLKMAVGTLGSSPEEIGDALQKMGLSAATKSYLRSLWTNE